ncbi:MAG: GTPase HflX [Anaerolineales bacterium]|nr:GTPase HflX [Anaerolineales bacterium]
MPKNPLPTELPKERAFLVGVGFNEQSMQLSVQDSLNELVLLADTAGLDIVGQASQRLKRPNPKTLLGSGKIHEIRDLVRESVADVVIFDEELSPRHQRELEKMFGDEVRILDRTALILDIFAQHAITREGALQVELAQYEYRLPRLTRAWTHLARQAGGGGGRAGSVGGVGLRGPGETQLEVDRREIGRRIETLRRQLEKVRAHRSRHRARRKRAEIPTIALVGYTNAGKSTLLNQLADANVLVADKLFATLDPTTRRVELPGGNKVLFTDTVGFIQKLPTMLVAAFRATLEEIGDADLLLHVVDITHPNAYAQAQSVRATLEEIEVDNLPVVTALNKIDLLQSPLKALEVVDAFERAVPISALNGEGIPTLLSAIDNELYDQLSNICVEIPYHAAKLISLFHEHGLIEKQESKADSVILEGRLPKRYLSEFRAYRRPDSNSQIARE